MSQTHVTVTAVRSFQFEDRYINKGDDVTLPAIHAAIEARKGNVSLARVQVRAMKADPTPEPPPPTRRRGRRAQAETPSQTYRRRDMTAEDPT